MARMVRKQFYFTPEQDARLKRLARCQGVTEAEVVRAAFDDLKDVEGAEDPFRQRLREAGLLVEMPEDWPRMSREELEESEREMFDWLAKRDKPLGLSQALREDRDSR